MTLYHWCKQESQRQLEQERFRPRTAAAQKSRDGTTLAEPFRLSSGNRGPSRSVQESLRKEQEQLTFKPQVR